MLMNSRCQQETQLKSQTMTPQGHLPWKKPVVVLLLLIYAYLWIAALIALFVANLDHPWSDFDAYMVVIANFLPLVKTFYFELDGVNMTFVVTGALSSVLAAILLLTSPGKAQ